MKTLTQILSVLVFSNILIACSGETDSSASTAEGSISTETNYTVTEAETPSTEPPADPAEEVAPPEPEEELTNVSITLSWTPPSTRSNGEPLELSEISGYEIYYFLDGTADGDGETATVDAANITQLTIDDLSIGTYYFSIAAIDTDGLASEMSEAAEAIAL